MAARISALKKKLSAKAATDPKTQDFLQQIEEECYHPLAVSAVKENVPNELRTIHQTMEEYVQLQRDSLELMRVVKDGGVNLVDLKKRWQNLASKRAVLAESLSQFKKMAHTDNAGELLAKEDEKIEPFLAEIKALIEQETYRLYGFNLITLGFLHPPLCSGKFQFLNPTQTALFISSQAFQALETESTEYQNTLAILAGMIYSPQSFLSPREKKVVENLQLKKGEMEYAKGLDLIRRGKCSNISLETLELAGDERAQKKLATLIGKQFLLKILSDNDAILMKTLVEIIQVNQQLKAQGAVLGVKAAFFPQVFSTDGDPAGPKLRGSPGPSSL